MQVYTLWKREVVRFARQRSRVTGAFLQPLVFWALLGVGLQRVFPARAGRRPTSATRNIFIPA